MLTRYSVRLPDYLIDWLRASGMGGGAIEYALLEVYDPPKPRKVRSDKGKPRRQLIE